MSPWIGPGRISASLHHQIIEVSWSKARQHGHLGPTLDLKHANGISLTDLLVNCGVFRWQRLQRQFLSLLEPHQVKALSDARQHPQ